MKMNLKKFSLIIALATIGTFSANAQISLGLTGGFATGMDLANPISGSSDPKKLMSDNGFGGGLTGRYWLNDKMAVGLNVSYFSFGVKDVPSGITSSYSIMPISLAFDYYFMDEGFKPFAGLEVGYLSCSWLAKYPADYKGAGNSAFDVSYANNGLFLAPVVGAAYGLNDNFDIILNAKYVLGLNGGKQDLKYSLSGIPSDKIDAIASSFVNINLGVSYKFGN